MWFENLMDDCKQGLALVWSNPWIALPYILHTLLVGIITVGLVAVSLVLFVVLVFNDTNFNWVGILAPFLIAVPLLGLYFSALTAMADAGSINIFALVAEGHKPVSGML